MNLRQPQQIVDEDAQALCIAIDDIEIRSSASSAKVVRAIVFEAA